MRVRVIGDRSRLKDDIVKAIEELEEKSKNNNGLNFQVALNYGGRDEITRAVRNIAQQVKDGTLKVEDINQDTISSCLDTADIPDPDLMIRTSGELRISNYLLWQLAYAELYFTSIAWPDFKEEQLYEALLDYQKRNRRFGALNEAN